MAGRPAEEHREERGWPRGQGWAGQGAGLSGHGVGLAGQREGRPAASKHKEEEKS